MSKTKLIIHGPDMTICSLAWFRSGLRDNGLGVAMAVAAFMDNKSGHVFVSQKKIAELLGIRSNNVPRAVEKAIDVGVLAKLSQGRSVTGRSNEYMVFKDPDPVRARLITTLLANNTSVFRDKQGWKQREFFEALRREPIEELKERLTSEQAMTHQRATNDSPVSKERLTSDVPSTPGSTPSSTPISTLGTKDTEDPSLVFKADDDTSKAKRSTDCPLDRSNKIPSTVSDNVAACGTALLLADEDVFLSVSNKFGYLHSQTIEPQRHLHVATDPRDNGENFEEEEHDWSNGKDSFDDPSEYRTYNDIPPPSKPIVPTGNDLWERLHH